MDTSPPLVATQKLPALSSALMKKGPWVSEDLLGLGGNFYRRRIAIGPIIIWIERHEDCCHLPDHIWMLSCTELGINNDYLKAEDLEGAKEEALDKIAGILKYLSELTTDGN